LPPKIALLSAGGLVLSLKTKGGRESISSRAQLCPYVIDSTYPVSWRCPLAEIKKRKGCPFFILAGHEPNYISFTSFDMGCQVQPDYSVGCYFSLRNKTSVGWVQTEPSVTADNGREHSEFHGSYFITHWLRHNSSVVYQMINGRAYLRTGSGCRLTTNLAGCRIQYLVKQCYVRFCKRSIQLHNSISVFILHFVFTSFRSGVGMLLS